jgi:DNA-directed RNA polymerase specialized sigma24 family protein
LDRDRRSRAGEDEALEIPDPRVLEADVARLLEVARVTEEVERLSSQCRELLTLLFLKPDSLPYNQVAAQLGVPIGSIGPNRARCLAELRKRMGKRALFRAYGQRKE